ncbi:hypothetical protein MJO28_002611 [Puccinia striiformis f. sp. tritici]|uniref:Uncharacterized protein n=1 Tax=Puccinia striiformis f. sp. tritici TaxID=168172 RepID=A0ACC0ETU7_9BASI|nr:hypothetical protein MJO28_002611 [Puccinia striiformis f. sp. tritici]
MPCIKSSTILLIVLISSMFQVIMIKAFSANIICNTVPRTVGVCLLPSTNQGGAIANYWTLPASKKQGGVFTCDDQTMGGSYAKTKTSCCDPLLQLSPQPPVGFAILHHESFDDTNKSYLYHRSSAVKFVKFLLYEVISPPFPVILPIA